MGELYLVRHGQASFGRANYDQLSELGYQQSRWLGEYFSQREIVFDRVLTGRMKRQHQTAESMLEAAGLQCAIELHPGFDEFDFKTLLNVFVEQSSEHNAVQWGNVKSLSRQLRLAMRAWAREELNSQQLPESWAEFCRRVSDALSFATQGRGNVLVSSSGGAISTAICQVLKCECDAIADLNMQAKNTGVSHFFFNQERIYLNSLNNTPHLDQPDRLHAITYL